MPCAVRIFSFTDGVKTVYQSKGEYTVGDTETEIRYRQDCSRVSLKIGRDGSVYMRRTGDCFLELPFRKGVLTTGTLGPDETFEKGEGVKKGNMPLYTEEIKYTVSEDEKSVSLYLKYIFRFDGGDRKCMVRVTATAEGSFKEFEK